MRARSGAVMCGLVLVAGASLQAADIKAAARNALEQAGKSVITIRVVSSVKMNVQGQDREQEQKGEATGVVVDPSGLTVACASNVDPGKQSRFGMKIDVTVKESTFILPDGTEVPAEIVLKDTDLDLAFLRPKEAGKTFDAVTFKPGVAPPKVLDDVFAIGRLGKEGNRALRAVLGIVQAEVKGPRTYYVCSDDISRNLGCLVYGADGAPLGIVVIKTAVGGQGEGGRGLMGMSGMGSIIIMRPVSDLLDALKQAKEAQAKPAEEKK